jgi:hypothetical protein
MKRRQERKIRTRHAAASIIAAAAVEKIRATDFSLRAHEALRASFCDAARALDPRWRAAAEACTSAHQ